MTDRKRLYQAVCDAPEDVPLRLVFADWLDDHDDPLGEFIRLQVRLAGLDPWDDGYHDLELRERELLLDHREAWERPISSFSPRDALFVRILAIDVFGRGLAENVLVEAGTFLRRHAELFRAAPVRSLRLFGAKGHLADLVRCPALGRVETLELESPDGDELGPDDAAALAESPHLANLCRLSVRSNRVGPAGVAALVASPYLRSLVHLDLSYNQIGDAGGEALAEMALPDLRRLDLGDNALTARGLGFLATPAAGRLTHLALDGNDRLRDDGAGLIAASRLGSELRGLNLYTTGIRRDGTAALARSRVLASVVDLDLGGNPIGPRGLTALAESPHLANVRRLVLRGGEVGPAGVVALLGSAGLPRLAWLDLSHNRVTDRCAKALAEAAFAGGLRHLDLAANSLTDAGVQALADAATFPALRSLRLSANDLDLAGLRTVVEAAAFAGVVSMNLSSNAERADAFCEWLATCPSAGRLRELHLDNSGITARGAAALAGAANLGGLVRLDVWNNRLGRKSAERLRERFGERVWI